MRATVRAAADFGTYRVHPGEHEEGELTKRIEHFTSQVPSRFYLTLALGSVGLAAGLYLAARSSRSMRGPMPSFASRSSSGFDRLSTLMAGGFRVTR